MWQNNGGWINETLVEMPRQFDATVVKYRCW
jgi:hypothetical protein